MRKQKLVLALAILLSTKVYGNFPQNVRTCIIINDNSSPYFFFTSFISSDDFDVAHRSNAIAWSGACANYRYTHGPTNLRFTVAAAASGMTQHEIPEKDIFIVLDSSCHFMQKTSNGSANSDYISIAKQNEYWNFYLTETPINNGYQYNYILQCKHFVS